MCHKHSGVRLERFLKKLTFTVGESLKVQLPPLLGLRPLGPRSTFNLCSIRLSDFLISLFTVQEQISEALKASEATPEEEEVEVEENDEDPPSDQEDGISGFGGGKPQGQEKPVPKRRRTKGPDNTLQSTSASATPAPAPVTGGASTGSQPSAPAKRKSGGQDAELAGLIKTAQSSCTSIRAVSPASGLPRFHQNKGGGQAFGSCHQYLGLVGGACF